ncbi:SIR2 family NAD-dependent protein deacylase [Nitrincola tapanii]|uniref:protein acetyllysine N-acetyltransferase n=1 Tax=Nitrincola tapanii TaxID=1708751 RepID=A0A5A9W6Q8_9GAMM|nr:Sir2 family NAD-dependent protein deacetylase [Nitrincola tapanii]KAA0876467.1 hypothetical protein E1H14_01710 [Nitrincola tapanii]
MEQEKKIKLAAGFITQAKKIVILAGSGMSADSGLPTFRDKSGYWKNASIDHFKMASYTTFLNDPVVSWSFYADRISSYRASKPHLGYEILHGWCKRLGEDNCFVFTSNVDQLFLKAGFADQQIYHCHGTLDFMYCSDKSCQSRQTGLKHNSEQLLLKIHNGALPICSCGQIMRPHVMMFGDQSFHHSANDQAIERWNTFLQSIKRTDNLVVLEIGAGSTVTTVEDVTWQLSKVASAVIQINPNKPAPSESDSEWINLNGSALATLMALDDSLCHDFGVSQ